MKSRGVVRIRAAPAPNSSSRCSGRPQRAGGVTPAGGGTCRPITPNIRPMKPAGVQLARAIVPPLRTTRSISLADRAWSGANITPNDDSTASKAPSSKGSASTSASRKVTFSRSAAARRRPSSSRDGT